MTDLLIWLAQGRALRENLGLPTMTHWIPETLPQDALLARLRPHLIAIVHETIHRGRGR